MSRIALVVTVTVTLACAACSEESTSSKERSSVGAQETDTGANEASTSEAGAPDPEDGRDTEPASCYAACSNTAFTCGTLTASLSPDSAGCTGTIGMPGGGATQTLKLDCGAKKVCVDSACVDGRYNATTFAYTPAGGTQIVCTRE